ncbi:MAG: response regulator, partial [Ancalomicrobiaceae bacterium]|nr:response regulator [Ancalomicrobiaceae bacterium]
MNSMQQPQHSPAQRNIVLVVDDSAQTVAMVAEIIEQSGSTALVALRGDRALSIARQITPDIILLDAVMPGMDGFETCRQLKKDEALAHVPVIFMTGLTDTDHVVSGFEAGGVDYVTKPIVPKELLARIRVHLANARIAHGAQAALDSTGRFLLAVDETGALLWWTPQAGRLITAFLPNGLLVGANLPEPVSGLILQSRREPATPLSVTLPGATTAINFEVVCQLAPNEFLMRITEEVIGDMETILRDRLQISDREAQVLTWIAQGKSNRDIAEILALSPRTVNKHLE